MFAVLATAVITAIPANANSANQEMLSGVFTREIAYATREVAYAAAASLAAVAGAVHDLSTRRIPNLLAASGLFCGLALHLLLGGVGELGLSALAGLAAGALFFVFYLAGGMGAGDVKLMAAVGCLAGCRQLSLLLMLIVVCGAVVAVGIALRHGMLRQTLVQTWMLAGHHRAQGLVAHPEWNAANASALRMPFAVPIAAGCALSLVAQIFNAWPGKG